MPIITRLEAQKHDPERVNVYLDGKFGFGASRLLIVARELAEGKELTAQQLEALKGDDELERAYNAALNYLSYRPRSRGEIESYFRRKKAEPAVAEAVVERLQVAGLVDDLEFARFWVQNRQTFRPRGVRALRVELRTKGLSDDVIHEALDELPAEEVSAYDAGIKKMRTFRDLDEREFFSRMVGFLQRRGFPYSAAASATKRLSEERGDASGVAQLFSEADGAIDDDG
jgi:regulatory protein